MVRGARRAALRHRVGADEHAWHRVRPDGTAGRPRRSHHVPEPARAYARGMMGRAYAFVACAMLVLGSTVWASPARAITSEACNQPIVVARLAFGPGTIPRGGSSTARLSGRNCTRHPRSVTIFWS